MAKQLAARCCQNTSNDSVLMTAVTALCTLIRSACDDGIIERGIKKQTRLATALQQQIAETDFLAACPSLCSMQPEC